MAQWGQGQQGFQYPMQTGFPGANQQFQQNPQFQPQNPQFQPQNPQLQQQQFQPGGLGIPNGGGLLPQQTGFPAQRQQQGFQQPQQTGFQPGSGFMQPQATGFPTGSNFQQQGRPPPPPVPPIPSQFQQPNQPSFLNMPPPNRLLSVSPGFGGGGLIPQATGFAGRSQGPLVPQMTGFIDPRLQMMSQTFMPMAGSVPQLPQQQHDLMQSIQQHNQTQRGSSNQNMAWGLSKGEKKNYDKIFRSWDTQNTGFISGGTALEVFGASGLPKDDLARIWTLADINDRGKLNIAEFHVAMGLIYRRINGMPVPDQLPQELIPPSVADLDSTVDRVKELLKSDTRSGSGNKHSFNSATSSPIDNRRDASNYKHFDSEPPGGFFKPSNRHVDRSAIRSRNDDGPAADLSDMKRQLENTAHRLDRAADADASRTKEDEELDQEMEDLKYKVKRVGDDLDYVARGPKSAPREEERRRLERELLSLMHERIPEVERKIKARDERKEKEKRQWTRDRDRANDRFGRYDSRDEYSRRDDRDRPYSRGGDRDRPYSRADDRPYSRGGEDRDRPYSRGGEDRDRPYSRGGDDRDRRAEYDRDDRGSYRRDRSRSKERDARDRGYDRPRSPPVSTRSPPPPTPTSAPLSAIRQTPSPAPLSSPSPSLKSMTPAERQAFARAEAQRRIQTRMAALGVTAPSASPTIDTTVEDRLQQEKKEAEEKTRAAEKQAEEREKARKDRLASEKALQDEKVPTPTPTSAAVPPPPTPTPRAAPPPAPTPTFRAAPPPAPAPKAAPPPPKSRAPAPPPPRKATAPRPPVAAPPAEPEVDPEEEAMRAREARLRKQREEREARMRQLEKEEEEEVARFEQERVARLEALKAKNAKPSTPPPAPVPPAPPAPAPPVKASPPPASRSTPVTSPAAEKSTNPFSRLIKEGGAASTAPSSPATNGNGNASTNPWARPQTTPPSSIPQPPKSPGPNIVKTNYQTAPSSHDDEWDDVKENDGSDDSSDDEIAQSRSARANIAQQLFGGILPSPAGPGGSASKPPTPAPSGFGANAPPPPAPPAPVAPPAPAPPPSFAVPAAAAAPPGDVNALMRSIQGGMKLKPTKTVDKSAPPVSGKVIGDTAPPSHINNAPRLVSPPRHVEEPEHQYPDTIPMSHDDAGTRSSNRQSVGWFADRAADVGAPSPVDMDRLPSTAEDEEEDDMYASPAPAPPAPAPPAAVPQIKVEEPTPEPMSDLVADIDKSIQHRVRSLYAFEGDGPEDLSFGENLVILANPSKSGGDWWYGKTVNNGKSGLFPKTYVEVFESKKAKAVFTYTGGNPDELAFTEGDTLSIIDMSEDEWWKAEQGGVVFIVPAAYLEIVEDAEAPFLKDGAQLESKPNGGSVVPQLKIVPTGVPAEIADQGITYDEDDDSDSDYLSFDESDSEDLAARQDKEARERERQLVLEAAGLIVNQDVRPPLTRVRSLRRRPAPAAPRRIPSMYKNLPPVPEPEPLTHEARLDDAFARYESFKNLQGQSQSNLNRLSVVSTDSGTTNAPPSPTATASSVAMSPVQKDGQGRSSHFFNFLTGSSKPPQGEKRPSTTLSTLNISAPIMNASNSQNALQQDGPSRTNSPAFGMSWASLVDKNALDGIPAGERKRQEAIFELINTEMAYVRDLQLIVKVFYSSMLSLLSTKEITVVFANIEDLLLTNTAFVSSLEERQKDCRLYIDKIGDILLTHIPNMGAYMEYCVNQSTAIKVLKSLRDSNLDLASHLQQMRDENPETRNLDLSSYLLAPMQRVTRYPLLIKQILSYTEGGEEHERIETARDMAERLLDHINESIREQEGQETLRKISQNLWIGQGRLDLTAPTRCMGPRRLLKQGVLMKSKSGRKLHGYLCSDILVFLDDSLTNLYRMPIPLAHAEVKESGSRDDTAFQITQAYPRGGDALALRATSARECQQWVNEIDSAGRRARHAEERAARKTGRR